MEKEIPITIGYDKNTTFITIDPEEPINSKVFSIMLGKWLSEPANLITINNFLNKSGKNIINTEVLISYVDDSVENKKYIKVFVYVNHQNILEKVYFLDNENILSDIEWYNSLSDERERAIDVYLKSYKIETPFFNNKDLPPYSVYKTWPTNPEEIEFIIDNKE